MPTALPRLRVLVAALAVAGVGLVLSPAGPGAPAFAAPAASGTPCPIPGALGCPPIGPTSAPSPTRAATAPATATARATSSPAPRRTTGASRSPRPRSTYVAPAGTTARPVTDVVSVGAVAGTLTPLPTKPEQAVRTHGGGLDLGRLVTLVLGAAVLLGIGGATGLYLTRHPHAH